MTEFKINLSVLVQFSAEEIDLIFESAQNCNIEISYLTLENELLYNWKQDSKNGQDVFSMTIKNIEKIRNGIFLGCLQKNEGYIILEKKIENTYKMLINEQSFLFDVVQTRKYQGVF